MSAYANLYLLLNTDLAILECHLLQAVLYKSVYNLKKPSLDDHVHMSSVA